MARSNNAAATVTTDADLAAALATRNARRGKVSNGQDAAEKVTRTVTPPAAAPAAAPAAPAAPAQPAPAQPAPAAPAEPVKKKPAPAAPAEKVTRTVTPPAEPVKLSAADVAAITRTNDLSAVKWSGKHAPMLVAALRKVTLSPDDATAVLDILMAQGDLNICRATMTQDGPDADTARMAMAGILHGTAERNAAASYASPDAVKSGRWYTRGYTLTDGRTIGAVPKGANTLYTGEDSIVHLTCLNSGRGYASPMRASIAPAAEPGQKKPRAASAATAEAMAAVARDTFAALLKESGLTLEQLSALKAGTASVTPEPAKPSGRTRK